MTVLITGGYGCIGVNLARRFALSGEEVICIHTYAGKILEIKRVIMAGTAMKFGTTGS